jgi:hypothetical protein
MKRFLSSPFFLVALIAFLFPFFTVECAQEGFGDVAGQLGGELGGQISQEQLQTTVTGLELITGEAEETLSETGEDDSPVPGPTPLPGLGDDGTGQQVDLGVVQILAIVAALTALLGIGLSLLAGRAGGIIALILGALGAILMFLLPSQLKSGLFGDQAAQISGIIKVTNEWGYWLALAGFILAALTGLLRLLMPDRPMATAAGPAPGTGTGFGPPPAPPPTSPPPPAAPPPGTPPATPPPAPPPPGTPPPGTPPP